MLRNKEGKPVLWLVDESGHIQEDPNEYQRKILDDDQTTYLFFVGGTGTGKSSLIPIKLFRWIRKRHGGRYLVTEPSYKFIERDAKPYVTEYFDHTPLKGKWSEKRQCYYGLNYEIFFGSADKPDLLEGGQYDGIICDEGAEYRRQVWIVLQPRILLKEGQLCIFSTPYPGRTQAWIADEPYEEWKGGNPKYKFVQCPSIANPAWPKDEFERLRREMAPAEFAMRYLGEFAAAVGLVYDLKKESIVPYREPPPNADVWCGMDFGFGHPTALAYFFEENGVVYQFREYEASAVDYETHVLNNLEPLMRYAVRRIYYDPSNPQGATEMKKWLKKQGLEISFLAAINDVNMGIAEVSKLLNTGRFYLMDTCLQTKEECRNYVWHGDKPLKEWDDLLDAQRYGLMGRRQFKAIQAKNRAPDEPMLTKAAQRIARIFRPNEINDWMGRV
jgi:hypothetical protein